MSMLSLTGTQKGSAPRVEGGAATLKALRQFNPKLRRATDRKIRRAADPLRRAVQARLPGVALSGWTTGRYAYAGSSARAGVKVRIGGKGRRSKTTWPLVTLQQRDAGGSVFDMAGRRSRGRTPQGVAFIANLNARFGTASRSMWPAAEQNLGPVRAQVVAAIDEASKQVNVQLRKR